MKQKHAAQFCPICESAMKFMENKSNPNNKWGYVQYCENCHLDFHVDETGTNPENATSHTIKQQAQLRQKFPGLIINLTKTELSIIPAPNLIETANEATVCFVWLINQLRKNPSIQGTQFDISKESQVNIGTVRITLSILQSANLLKKANKVWQFNKDIAIKFPRRFPAFKSKRGGRSILDLNS
jgi:hypothetical protein